ncbi:phospholipase D family protein [Vannielia litorea]|uniref:phospholipase D family protein n=1 Tax=Vannielia litorea TaxID=1217970 RepID=UPI001BCBE785
MSGFIKSGLLPRAGINKKSDLRVFSRWRLSDLVGGGSDLDAAREVLAVGGNFSIHPRLHAKVFVFDDIAFVGSANLTGSGLPTVEGTGNLEAALATPQISEVVDFVTDLCNHSMLLSDELVEEISREVERLTQPEAVALTEASTRMPAAFERVARETQQRPFTGADFPWCDGPAEVMIGEVSEPSVEHDLELFSLAPNPSLAALKTSFLQSRCYAWLSSQTEDEVRYGDLTARLHDALDGDPRPYRREVKRLLSNLLAWAVECDPDRFLQISHSYTRSYRSVR